MNLFEWQHKQASQQREYAKAALREGHEFEDVMPLFPHVRDWEGIAEELDAEQFVVPLEITEYTEIAGREQVAEGIYQYADFIPEASGQSYTVSFVAHTSFINENAALLAAMQERLGATGFVSERVEDGISMVCFTESQGTPVARRTHKIAESPMTLWAIEPTPTIQDQKRDALRDRIYGA